MKKILLLILTIILFLSLSGPILAFDLLGTENDRGEEKVNLAEIGQVFQKFTTSHDNLFKVKVFLDEVEILPESKIEFFLVGENQKDILVQKTILAQNVKPGFFSFEFEPIRKSKDKTYYFVLKFVGSSYEKFILKYSKERGDLVFRTYYQDRRSFPKIFLDSFLGKLKSDLGFSAFYLTSLGILALSLIRAKRFL